MKGAPVAINLDKLRTLAAEGKPDREIAEIFGCSEQAVQKRRKDAGIPSSRASYKVDVDVDRIRELAGKGLGDRQIAAELGCNDNIVRARRLEHGIPAGRPGCGGSVRDFSRDLRGGAHTNVTLADAAFAKLIGDQRFQDVKLTPARPLVDKRHDGFGDRSYTGCAAGMCAL